ncbi:MAG: glycosyltransferase family 2 protein [Coleofasciculus sp. G3-WIS-01]|uniref:glycosyltransferase family 2 protein n=1 Tax=Coleofasciculus sp. G3-WIS-01 TaxID=3069528 RepID=UPI0032F0B8BB
MFINPPWLIIMEIILFAIALSLLVPIGMLFIECFAALFPQRQHPEAAPASPPRITVLIPAHNEASGISTTLKTIVPQLTDQDRLVVIADNCTDETAAIARQLGATVIERQDTERQGKGYALDYGIKHLATDPPDIVVLVDADCIVHQGAIAKLAQRTNTSKRPTQAIYLLEQPPNPTPKDTISALAFRVKNLVRPCGLNQLGFPCLLTGTGMAFPWSVIHQAPLASNNIVEDMQLGIDLAIAGHPPLFCLDARVTGCLPQQQEAAKTQRTRWEHGHLQTLLTQVPRLLSQSLFQRRVDLFAIALDLVVPPLSLLVMIWVAAMGGTLLAAIVGVSWIPAIFVGLEGLLILLSIIGAWAKFCREDIPAQTLLTVPFYILWKIPLYLAFLVKPENKWIRTERDAVDVPES